MAGVMEVIICPDKEEAARIAARIFQRQSKRKRGSVFGLATGSTPLGLYKELAAMAQKSTLDLSQSTTFNLDEYIGLPAEHPASYSSFMQKHFFDFIEVGDWNIPDGMALDIPAHCAEYEGRIRQAGGIDLQLLGLGSDGHIGFNEPTSSLASRTRIKTLTERTIQDNARFFGSVAEVPRHVITMGVGTICESRHCLVLAFGNGKAEAVAAMVEGPMTANVPASVLQMHPVCTAIIDEEAASKLARYDYYKWVFSNKPKWQQI